jgi:hypothetical protein
MLAPYVAAASEIIKASCAEAGPEVGPEVGMDFPPGNYEYPMLALLGADRGATRVRHVNVIHPSRIYAAAGDWRPCAVVCLMCPPEKAQKYSATARRVLSFDGLTVFVFKD